MLGGRDRIGRRNILGPNEQGVQQRGCEQNNNGKDQIHLRGLFRITLASVKLGHVLLDQDDHLLATLGGADQRLDER